VHVLHEIVINVAALPHVQIDKCYISDIVAEDLACSPRLVKGTSADRFMVSLGPLG
jgi:hypothetical protein